MSIFDYLNRPARKWLIASAIALIVFALVFYAGSGTNRVKQNRSAIIEKAKSEVVPNAEDFAKHARQIREQSLLKVQPRVFMPTSWRPAAPSFPWKKNIVTTVFWIGEEAGGDNHHNSSWHANWTSAYGGFDNPDPSSRRNYIPVSFTPRQNPFYCALPYNDLTHSQFKPEASLVIPWFKQAYTEPGRSVCKDRWVAIRKGNRTCYAQWEDCGPFRDDYFQYVFLNERPKLTVNHGAGLDVSPAVRDYLDLRPTDITDWKFVEVRDVSPGPWRTHGDNNHFKRARQHSLINSRMPLSDSLGPDWRDEEP